MLYVKYEGHSTYNGLNNPRTDYKPQIVEMVGFLMGEDDHNLRVSNGKNNFNQDIQVNVIPKSSILEREELVIKVHLDDLADCIKISSQEIIEESSDFDEINNFKTEEENSGIE